MGVRNEPRAADADSAGAVAEMLMRTMRVTPREPSQVAAAEDARANARARQRAEREQLEPRIDPRLLALIRGKPTPCAILLGPTGIGKTAAARWLALGAGRDVFEIRASRLCSSQRRHGLGEGDSPEISRARTARLLLLDDIGTEAESDVGVLQETIDARYNASLATIVTSGLSPDALTARIGAHSVRRLKRQHVSRGDGSEFPMLIVDLCDSPAERASRTRARP